MSYSFQPMGLDLADVIAKGGPAVEAVSKVIQDPALPEVTCHLLRLNKLTEGRPPGPPCTRRSYSAAQRRQGVGLTLAVRPLRAAVWARENPVAAVAVGAGAVGALVGVGYLIGRRRG